MLLRAATQRCSRGEHFREVRYIVGLSLSFANLCVIFGCFCLLNLRGGHRSSGAMELVWENWKLYSEAPRFSGNGRGLCLITDTVVPVVPTKKASRKLLAGVVTDTI